jgi:hypothetical protein
MDYSSHYISTTFLSDVYLINNDVGIFGLGGVVGDAYLGQKPTCTEP